MSCQRIATRTRRRWRSTLRLEAVSTARPPQAGAATSADDAARHTTAAPKRAGKRFVLMIPFPGGAWPGTTISREAGHDNDRNGVFT